ncbi:MAG: AraC family transcriptional regulator [Devosia nanyangense]|uniref:AraC family transcriptional regulator n=1 Tax=Devosia nanyangense TaxID=1228055 RepID=A0A933NXB6_9HYPH|nr:AraC family transcriptional regulator [Devosia nanyangense]
MSAIAKTVWLIESRFRDALSLDEMAEHAGVSRSHLSRIFPIATGYSLSAYVRGRRLTEAAKVLADGAPDILGVALDAGYGSHEAFTRAFREQFALTPDELRKRRSLNALPLVEPLNMDSYTEVRLAPPKIEDHPAMRLAGIGQHYTTATLHSIPDQWSRFGPLIGQMVGDKSGDSFGVVGRMEGSDGGFDYFTAVPIGPDLEMVPGVTVMSLPAARYARFRHQGHISDIRSTCAAVFDDGVPALGVETDPTYFSFLEYYGEDFNPQNGTGTVEIWVALKK